MTDSVAPRRTLVLLRHAKSAWPDVRDHDRPLAPRGRRDAPVAGRWLRAARLVPDQVLCSTAKRTRQTWQLAAPELLGPGRPGGGPPVTFEPQVYEASVADLLGVLHEVSGGVRTLLLIGHEPGMSRLALTLADPAGPIYPADPADFSHPADSTHPAGPGSLPSAREPAARDLGRIRAKFPTAAIAVLELTGAWSELGPGGARLTSFMTPSDIRSSTGR